MPCSKTKSPFSFNRLTSAEYDFDDAIETTAEDIDTKKAIHSRSQGEAGLSALLEKRNRQEEPKPEREPEAPNNEETASPSPVDEPIDKKQEIIPKEPEDAPESIVEDVGSIPEEQESYDYDELPF